MRRLSCSTLIALLASTPLVAAGDDLADVEREVAARHDEAVARLASWIAVPSIAAENRFTPAGPSTWPSSWPTRASRRW